MGLAAGSIGGGASVTAPFAAAGAPTGIKNPLNNPISTGGKSAASAGKPGSAGGKGAAKDEDDDYDFSSFQVIVIAAILLWYFRCFYRPSECPSDKSFFLSVFLLFPRVYISSAH